MENEIREFFRQTAPQPSDPTAFRLELNARLAAVEQIKAYRDREIRRERRTLMAVFAVGLLFGAALAVFLIFHPVQLPDLSAWADDPAQKEASLHILWPLGVLIAALSIVLPLRRLRRRSIL